MEILKKIVVTVAAGLGAWYGYELNAGFGPIIIYGAIAGVAMFFLWDFID